MLSRITNGLVSVALAATVAACATTKPAEPAPKPEPKAPEVAKVPVVALPVAGSPLVAVRLVFAVGSVDDPEGKEGLAALTAAMLAEGGTKARTYSEVLDALYPMAASIDVTSTKEWTTFRGTIHVDKADEYVALLKDQILTPRMSKEDFERLRKRALDYVTRTLRSDDDEELGKHALEAFMYAGHPYGYPTAGTVEGLKAITLEDVKAFYADHFGRGRLTVGVAAAAPKPLAQGLADDLAKALPAVAPRDPARVPSVAVGDDGLKVLAVDKNTQSVAISMGHPLPITRADDDFYPLLVAASYLGEHRTFNGLLMQEMRGKRGLNYGDYAYVEKFIQQGWSTFPKPNIQRSQQQFEIWIRPVAPKNAGFAVRAALYETDKLVREGIPQQGFEDTRQFLMGYSRLWAQSPSRRLGYAMDGELVGKEIAAELRRRLPTMTKADVDRAIAKYIHPGKLRIAIAAKDARGLADKLVSGDPTPIVYDTEGTPPEVLDKDKKIESFPLGLTADHVTVVPVDELFQTRSLEGGTK